MPEVWNSYIQSRSKHTMSNSSRITRIEEGLRGLEGLTRAAIQAVGASSLPLHAKIHYNILVCGISKGLSATSLNEACKIFVQTYTAVVAVEDSLVTTVREYLEDAIIQYRLASRHNIPLYNCKTELLWSIKQIGLAAK